MSFHQPSSDALVGNLGRAILLGTAMLFAAGFLVALSVSPDPRGYGTHQQLGLAPCSFRLFVGYPCAGCGMTTSFAHFVRGQFADAARANPVGLIIAALCALGIPWCGLSACTGRLWMVSEPWMTGITLVLSLSVLTVLFWIVRLIGLCT